MSDGVLSRACVRWGCGDHADGHCCGDVVLGLHGRLSAVENLIENWSGPVTEARSLFKTLPDIDRLLSRVHTLGIKLAPDHPEREAVYYESTIYNKRKIRDFLTALRGLKVSLAH